MCWSAETEPGLKVIRLETICLAGTEESRGKHFGIGVNTCFLPLALIFSIRIDFLSALTGRMFTLEF